MRLLLGERVEVEARLGGLGGDVDTASGCREVGPRGAEPVEEHGVGRASGLSELVQPIGEELDRVELDALPHLGHQAASGFTAFCVEYPRQVECGLPDGDAIVRQRVPGSVSYTHLRAHGLGMISYAVF